MPFIFCRSALGKYTDLRRHEWRFLKSSKTGCSSRHQSWMPVWRRLSTRPRFQSRVRRLTYLSMICQKTTILTAHCQKILCLWINRLQPSGLQRSHTKAQKPWPSSGLIGLRHHRYLKPHNPHQRQYRRQIPPRPGMLNQQRQQMKILWMKIPLMKISWHPQPDQRGAQRAFWGGFSIVTTNLWIPSAA